tara:strand:+ start:2848 stop:4122 length:1275 start_codon:yes stop_codon:yes gene_type:complete
MRTYKSHIFTLIIIFFNCYAFSQNTGSPYSLNELGEINFLGNVSNISMGGVNSLIDSIEFNINNPSSLAKLQLTNYQVGTFYKSSSISNNLNTDKFNSANINYIAIGIPTKKFGFGFGVLPYSSVGFNLQTSNDYNSINSLSSRLFAAEGNLNRVFFSLGIPLFKFFSVGGSLNYNFGKFSYEKYNQYDNINYGTYSYSSSEITGFNYIVSSSLTIPLKNDLKASFIFNYNPSTKLNSYNVESLYTSTSFAINTETLGDFIDVDLSLSGLENTDLIISDKSIYSFGLEKKNKWFLGVQYENKLSSSFDNKFLSLSNISYRDSKVFSIGAYYIPDSSSLTSYWKRVKYRFGVRNEVKSILLNNLPVNQFSLNLGLGLPFSGFSKVNFGLEVGTIEDDNQSLKENYFSLRLGLSLNDIWFIKRKFN